MTEVKTRTRTCDQCGTDLTETDAPYGWHYVLSGEFTPSIATISYSPHPTPPQAKHFCDAECLATSFGLGFGGEISSNMWNVGGDAVTAFVPEPNKPKYVVARRLAQEVFRVMWRARETSMGTQERKSETNT